MDSCPYCAKDHRQVAPDIICYQKQIEQLQAELEKMKYDLAIIYEHTNLADSNKREAFIDANRMIRNRTQKYENLRLTAGLIYGDGLEGK